MQIKQAPVWTAGLQHNPDYNSLNIRRSIDALTSDVNTFHCFPSVQYKARCVRARSEGTSHAANLSHTHEVKWSFANSWARKSMRHCSGHEKIHYNHNVIANYSFINNADTLLQKITIRKHLQAFHKKTFESFNLKFVIFARSISQRLV